jgi:ABC-type lipoprotein release transport system permease subunit
MLILTVAAVSQRYTALVSQSYSIYNAQVVVVSKASLLLEGLPLGGTIPETAGSLIERVDGVASVTPMLIVVNVKQLVPSNITIGVPLHNFTMFGDTVPLQLEGAYPSSSNQIVLGAYLAKTANLVVGSELELGNTTLQVSGIISTSNLILDNAAIMPLQTAQATQGYEGFVSAFLVSIGGNAGVTTSGLIASINSEIPGVDAIDPKQSDFFTSPLVSSVGLINESVAAFSELVAFLFVAIISVVNIAEQKDEFVTIRSIGSPSSAILKIAAAEGGIIGLFGVLLGSLLASLAIGTVFQAYASIPFDTSVLQFFKLVPLQTTLYSGSAIIALGIAVSAIASTSMMRRLK